MKTATAPVAAPEASVQPGVYTRRTLAQYLSRSLQGIDRDIALGRLPAGFRIGSSRYWRRDEIEQWIDAGCPEQGEWEARKSARRRGA